MTTIHAQIRVEYDIVDKFSNKHLVVITLHSQCINNLYQFYLWPKTLHK